MRHMIKFKSFEEAKSYTLKEFCQKSFNPEKTGKFFQEYSGYIKNPYKPGIYRFKSFENAREYNLRLQIRMKNK